MAQEWAAGFYKSSAWRSCRAAYVRHARGLCERCLARGLVVPGVIVHHKCHLTAANITDPDVSLNWENLELLCRACHAEAHKSDGGRRYRFDEFGRLMEK